MPNQVLLVPTAAPPSVAVLSPETAEQRDAVREQLERLLASPVFRNSKICSSLLKYVVYRTIEGGTEHLKERTIGIEAFGRAVDYDTNSDHVVRSAAGEVRKRLAQYYLDPGHETEIRIDFPPGSYVPQFRLLPVKPFPEMEMGTAETPVALSHHGAPALSHAKRPRWRFVWILACAALAAFVTLISSHPSPQGTLDLFWRPLFSSSNPILLCVGNWDQPVRSANTPAPAVNQTTAGQSMTLGAFHRLESQKVFLDDAITLSKLTGFLQGRSRQFRIRSHSTTTFVDLQNGPAVLIGLKSNYWTSSLVDQLRFSVEAGDVPGTQLVRDKKNPGRNNLYVNLAVPYMEITKDYALVVRVLDPKTEQMVVTAAGITTFGTLAAGEFITNPEQMKKLNAFAPRGWERKNLEVVLSTNVIKGNPGPPSVVAAEFW